jgi:DnaJ family protein C protein 2
MEFNDTIPEKFNPEKDDFFETFAPVFRRNAYFSKKTPVPLIGEPTEDIKKVHQFYNFWDNFETWREFIHEEEYDISQAENKYERRYMEQANRKLKAPLLKKEKLRLNKLVNLAYNNDPRIKAMIAKQEEERLAKKRDKQAQKDAKRSEEQARMEKAREDIRLRDEAAKEKEQREKDQLLNRKKQRKENEKTFRDLFKAKVSNSKFDDYYIDEVLLKVHDDDFSWAFEFFEGCLKFEPTTLHQKLQEAKKCRLNNEEPVKPIFEIIKEDKPELEWTTQEFSLLTKGVAKFPAGTQDRWNRIALYIGGRFSEAQVLEKAKALKNKHKNELAVKIPNFVNTKVEPIITEIPVVKEEPKKSNPVLLWSQDQQSQLEKALKKYPATIPMKERWEKIANEVEEKSMKECVERFKWIKENLKAKNN